MPREKQKTDVEDSLGLLEDLVRLASVATSGDQHKGRALTRSLARKYRPSHPDLASDLVKLVRASPVRSGRGTSVEGQPLDADSRQALVREEYPVHIDHEPVFSADVADGLSQLVLEDHRLEHLHNAGLDATSSALLVGPPGVGKTLAARWLARELDRTLITLDLTTVMSSFLGRTGGNVRRVLDYAKGANCVLLLDELDAIAKRRDDDTEVGELKRLVTVLLQEIDHWPTQSLLIAATNHEELLDPAVWRRFDRILEFPLPEVLQIETALDLYLGSSEVDAPMRSLLAELFEGCSFSEIERAVTGARRASLLKDDDLEYWLLAAAAVRSTSQSQRTRVDLSVRMVSEFGISQRRASELTGVSRDTIRKHAGHKHQRARRKR